MILTFLVVSYFGLPGKEVSNYAFLINFTILQYGLQIPSVDGVYWSLFHELMFYFLIAFLFRLVRTKYLFYLSFFWLLLTLINWVYHINGLSLLLNLSYAPLFLGGIYFYKLSVERTKINAILPGVCCLVYLIIIDSSPDRIFIDRLITVGFYVFFYLYTFNRLKFIAIKPLIFLGNISYPLYLIHQNFGYIILRKLYSIFGTYQILILIPIVLSIGFAYLLTEYLEKPVIRYLRSFIVRLQVIKERKL